MAKSARNLIEIITNTLKLTTVEPYLFLTTFGVFVTMVPLQSLLMDRACRITLNYTDEICDDMDHYEKEQKNIIEIGNNLYTAVILATSLPAAGLAIFLGPWSDKYSRKWPLVLAVSGLLVESIVLLLLTVYKDIPPMWFIVASVTSGLSGGYIICYSASGSYLSDVTEERSRPARLAVLDFFFISATVFGSVLGGQIFEAYGYLTVICVGPFFYFFALLYTVLVLKDTKPPIPADQRKTMICDLFTLENIKQSYRICTKKRQGNIRLQIWLLIFVDTCYKFVAIGTIAVAFSFAKQMYKMGVTEFSNANTVFSVVNAMATVTVIPFLTKKMQLHEAAIGLIGVLSLTAKMVISSVAYSLPCFYYGLMSGALLNCIGVAAQSRLSKLVGKEELGRAFSLLGTSEAFAPMLGTAFFFQVYNASSNFFPGLMYASAGLFLIPSAVIFGWMTKLPTVSLGEYGRNTDSNPTSPLENMPPGWNRLREEETSY